MSAFQPSFNKMGLHTTAPPTPSIPEKIPTNIPMSAILMDNLLFQMISSCE